MPAGTSSGDVRPWTSGFACRRRRRGLLLAMSWWISASDAQCDGPASCCKRLIKVWTSCVAALQSCLLSDAVDLLFSIGGDPIGYTCGITACRGRQWPKTLMLLERMGQERVLRDELVMNSVCSALERVTLWHGSLQLMPPNLRAISSTIHACVKGGQWHSATSLLHGASSARVVVDSVAATPLLDSHWLRGVMLLTWMQQSSLEADEVSQEAFCHSAGQAEQWRKALWAQSPRKLAAALSGRSPSAWRFAAASLVYLSERSLADATNCCMTLALCAEPNWRLAQQLLLSALAASPCNVDAAVCTAAVSAATAAGILSLMRQRAICPSCATAVAATSALVQKSLWRQAGVLLAKMQEHALLPSIALQNVEVSAAQTRNAWATALQSLQSLQLAVATRPGSAGSAGSDPAWTSAVAACDWVEAWQLLRRMEELQLEVSQVTATAAAGSSWEDALAAVALRASGAALAALMKGAKAGCAGCWSRALQLALAQRECPSMDPKNRDIGFNSAVAACGLAGEWQLAQHVFRLHGHDAVGLSAALGPWKAALALLRASASVDDVCP